ncbi:hypothetical protein IAG43_06565 [Streptomyces genisteinicus]|uniref:Uncharacterized protein n=1 Tax=Streptomyces genisteinicus TaxID=2768068 RepID=A0A7H0HQ15_9ACTN|nr:hypothetical protein [Streptomyces genisteinicus]QNP62631.1 hypothetical protein IAG43_06565 [Streptomyces genisteinicus]
MPDRTQTSVPLRTSGAGAVRLPWWALALPVLAFVALLTLIAGPAEAHAAGGSAPGAGQVIERIHALLAR